MTEFRIGFITVPSQEEGLRLAEGLVEQRLAACVNIIPGIQSVYRWQGQIHRDSELLLLCKTHASQWEAFCEWVIQHHSYEVPEIIQAPIIVGSSAYLDWLADCLNMPTRDRA